VANLTIDGQQVEAPGGTLLLDVLRGQGLDIPTLCHRRELPSFGACRLCTVEVEQGGRTRLQSSCSTPVSDDMVVRTDTDRVKNGRRIMGELLLARCPDNESVREIVAKLGVTSTGFTKRQVVREGVEEDPFNRAAARTEDCVLCGLCVRACGELAGVHAIEFAGRGSGREVTTPFGRISRVCVGCGACAYVCPTGAIDMEGPALARFRELSAERRLCRYMRMGIVSHKICPNDYRCGQCEYDQEMEDMMGSHPVLAARPGQARRRARIEGLTYLPTVAYHPQGHTWVRRVGEVLKVGLDAFRVAFLGAVTRIELPAVGTEISRGEPVLGVETDQGRIDLPCPVSGEVVSVNQDLAVQPELVGLDPYARGWLVIIKPQNVELELQYLIKDLGVPTWLNREVRRLRDCLPPGHDQVDDLEELLAGLDPETLGTVGQEFFVPVRPMPTAAPR
jgi:bidirectional [NiFe] hydrogenase diaphorase subunit